MMHKKFVIALLIYSIIFPIVNHLLADSRWEVISRGGGILLLLLIIVRLGRWAGSSLLDLVMLFYLGYLLFSGILALSLPSSSVTLYLYGLGTIGIPMLFYYVGRNRDLDTINILHAIWVVGLVHISFAILTYSFLPYPSWWHAVLRVTNPILEMGLGLRMMSVSGSLAFGVLAATTLILSLYRYSLHKTVGHFAAIVLCLAGVLFSLQRSAWAVALGGCMILVLLLLDPVARAHFYQKSKQLGFPRIQFARSIAIVIGLVILLMSILAFWPQLSEDLAEQITSRLLLPSALLEAWAERAGQRANALLLVRSYPLGVGLGQLGFTAVFSGVTGEYTIIPDTNYGKILGELGPPGLIFQLAFFFPTIVILLKLVGMRYRSWGHYLMVSTIALIAVQYYVQALGSNVWDLYYVNIVFWLCMGLMAKEYQLAVHQRSAPAKDITEQGSAEKLEEDFSNGR